jgi:hypothetical protein
MKKIKRIGARITAILIVFLLLLFIFKNQLLKIFIEHQIRTKLHSLVQIESVRWYPGKVTVLNLEIAAAENTFRAGELEVHFEFAPWLRPRISQVELAGLECDIVDLGRLGNKYQALFAGQTPQSPRRSFFSITGMRLLLDDARVTLVHKNLSADIDFSVGAIFEEEIPPRIEDISVSQANLKWNKIEVSDVTLNKDQDALYTLTIPSLVIEDKEMGELTLPLKIEKKQITLLASKNPWIGDHGYTEGIITYTDQMRLCLDLSLNGFSMEHIVKVIGKEDEVSCYGEFGGNMKICLDKLQGWGVQGALVNKGDGYINVKKSIPGNFLNKYLDQASSNALIDNLKNYEYNSGAVEIVTVDDDITLTLRFDSQRAGKRNFVVTFHDIIERE